MAKFTTASRPQMHNKTVHTEGTIKVGPKSKEDNCAEFFGIAASRVDFHRAVPGRTDVEQTTSQVCRHWNTKAVSLYHDPTRHAK